MNVWRTASVKRLFCNGTVAGVLAATVILLILTARPPIFEGSSSVLLFLIAALLAAWRGGFGAGFAVTAFSALASAYFLLEPYDAWGGHRTERSLSPRAADRHRHRPRLGC